MEAVQLEEHQRLQVIITSLPGAVAESRGIIPASAEVVEEVAEGDEFLLLTAERMVMPSLANIPAGTAVFIDANLFIYHVSGGRTTGD